VRGNFVVLNDVLFLDKTLVLYQGGLAQRTVVVLDLDRSASEGGREGGRREEGGVRVVVSQSKVVSRRRRGWELLGATHDTRTHVMANKIVEKNYAPKAAACWR
jgi:hypothetical protein